MTQAAAPMSTAIKVITGLVLAMAAVMLLAGTKVWGLSLGGQSWRRSPGSAIFGLPWPMSSQAMN